MLDLLSLSIPLAYLGVLLGSLATFSSLYRSRKARKASSLAPWFPPHLQRDIYFSLLHLDSPSSSSSSSSSAAAVQSTTKKTPAVPDTILKAALLRRATEDINRVLALRDQKPALAMLLQRGSVGDDLWQQLLRAERELEEEVRDVISEANAYTPNWGQTIFQSANELLNNIKLRNQLNAEQEKLNDEKVWWEQKKASIKEGFMKELDQDNRNDGGNAAAGATAAPEAQSGASTTTSKTFEPVPSGQAEAEGEGDAASSGGSKKKKKGKK